jgi:hypothetical protein
MGCRARYRALRNIRIRHTASVTENPRLTRGPEMIAGAAEIGLQTAHWRRQKFRNDFNKGILEMLRLGDTQEFQNARNPDE